MVRGARGRGAPTSGRFRERNRAYLRCSFYLPTGTGRLAIIPAFVIGQNDPRQVADNNQAEKRVLHPVPSHVRTCYTVGRFVAVPRRQINCYPAYLLKCGLTLNRRWNRLVVQRVCFRETTVLRDERLLITRGYIFAVR